MMYDIEKIWTGEKCYIIGGGPSVKRLKTEELQGKNIIVVNNAFKLFFDAAFCVFMDKEFWGIHEKSLENFPGILLSIHASFKEHPRISYILRGPAKGLSQNSGTLRNGNNSGYVAFNLACLLGVSEIYLVGFDMRVVSGEHNYHKEHTRKMDDSVYSKQYIKAFESADTDLRNMNIKVFNATPNSALTCFPFADNVIENIYAEHNIRS